MLVVKAVTYILAAVVSILAVKYVMGGWQSARVPVKSSEAKHRAVKRLRQDPRTGVYFPEE